MPSSTEGLEWVDLETTRQRIYRIVTWISLDQSTFYAYHIFVCLWISYDMMFLYVLADDADLICLFVSGSDLCDFIYSMIEQKQFFQSLDGVTYFWNQF